MLWNDKRPGEGVKSADAPRRVPSVRPSSGGPWSGAEPPQTGQVARKPREKRVWVG